jgi:putative IMPACT (imprinted ancient) family translation regulator
MSNSEYLEITEEKGPFIFKDRGSKFYGYAAPFNHLEDFKSMIGHFRFLYPKANHVVSAYRDQPQKNQTFCSDDGEPKNSSGPPVLGQILQHNLYNTAVFVVREFGGKPLGIPGLISAYKTTANGILLECKKMKVTPSINYTVQLDYTNKNWLSEIIEKHDGKIKSTSYLESISMSFTIPLSMNELFLSDLKNNKRYVDLIISESEKVD